MNHLKIAVIAEQIYEQAIPQLTLATMILNISFNIDKHKLVHAYVTDCVEDGEIPSVEGFFAKLKPLGDLRFGDYRNIDVSNIHESHKRDLVGRMEKPVRCGGKDYGSKAELKEGIRQAGSELKKLTEDPDHDKAKAFELQREIYNLGEELSRIM